MAEKSKIAWTDHTFNPVRGCEKVSQGCKFCYAERDTKRYGLKLWGPLVPRQRTSKDYWKQPRKWNERARKSGVRERVFCASFADVGESHPDWIEPRRDLVRLIEETPDLDWLLLTKRPENMRLLFSEAGWPGIWPQNVWAGCTVENQEVAEERIQRLFEVPAIVRFVSCEPLLGPLDLTPWLVPPYPTHNGDEADTRQRQETWEAYYGNASGLDWVICGGESGPSARTFDLAWARSLRDQCEGKASFFFKQLGDNSGFAPTSPKGTDPEDWPEDLRKQQIPTRLEDDT